MLFQRKNLKGIPNPYKVRTQVLQIGSEGSKIFGRLLLPMGKEGNLPTVICSHGLNSSYRATEYMIGKTLAGCGYAVYCYDFRGGSYRSRSQGDRAKMSVFTERDDLLQVLDHIRQLPFVDTNRLFLFGESQGGFVSAITADQRSDDIQAMVLYYPAFCIPEDARKRYPNVEAIPEKTGQPGNMMGKAYHEKLYDYDVYRHLAGFTKPVLMIHGDKDTVVNLPYVQRALEVYSNAHLQVLPGEGHGFSPAAIGQAAKLVYEFLKEQTEERV